MGYLIASAPKCRPAPPTCLTVIPQVGKTIIRSPRADLGPERSKRVDQSCDPSTVQCRFSGSRPGRMSRSTSSSICAVTVGDERWRFGPPKPSQQQRRKRRYRTLADLSSSRAHTPHAEFAHAMLQRANTSAAVGDVVDLPTLAGHLVESLGSSPRSLGIAGTCGDRVGMRLVAPHAEP